jgi:hypothetical protein
MADESLRSYTNVHFTAQVTCWSIVTPLLSAMGGGLLDNDSIYEDQREGSAFHARNFDGTYAA